MNKENAGDFAQYDIHVAEGVSPKVDFTNQSLHVLHSTEDRHFWSRIKRRLVVSFVSSHFNIKDTFSMMDIGCGNGSLLKEIGSHFPQSSLIGVDGIMDALIHCRKRLPSAHLYLCDINNLEQIGDNSCDLVTVMDVLEHIENPSKVLKEIVKKLKPDGIVIASVPACMSLWSERDEFLGHKKRYTSLDFVNLFLQNRIKIIKNSYLFSYLYFPALLNRKIFSPLLGCSGEKMEKNELKIIPFLNELLIFMGKIEVFLVRWIYIPTGTSTFVIGQK